MQQASGAHLASALLKLYEDNASTLTPIPGTWASTTRIRPPRPAGAHAFSDLNLHIHHEHKRLQQQDWSTQQRRALTPDELRTALADLPGWQLDGDAIAKSYAFANYYETWPSERTGPDRHHRDHHPDLTVSYGRCGVRLNTHDVNGISSTDIECARRIDALLERP